MFLSALSKPNAKRKTSFTLTCLMIYLDSFFLSSKTIYFLQTWFYSIYMLASRRVPKAHEVLNKHRQNQHEFQHGVKQPLSQKISFRIGSQVCYRNGSTNPKARPQRQKGSSRLSHAGEEAAVPSLPVTTRDTALSQLSTKVQASTHTKPGWPLFREEQNCQMVE